MIQHRAHLRRNTAGTLTALAISTSVLVGVATEQASAQIAQSGQQCFTIFANPGDAAVVNLTPVDATAFGNGQLISSDIRNEPPVASNTNFGPNSIDPNIAIATVGSDQQVCFQNSVHANVELVADHLGTIGANVYTPATSSGAPERVVDTRSGVGGQTITPSGQLCFPVTGNPGDAAVVNLTPVNAMTPGNGQLLSSNVRADPPTASNVNFGPGTIDPNVAISEIGNDGRVCFQNSIHGQVDLIADHLGTIDGSAYNPATTAGAPARRVDTRVGLNGLAIAPGGQLCFAVSGNPGDAAIVNLTPLNASAAGNGQLISSDARSNPPTASNVNFAPGTIDPNVAVTEIGSDGRVCFQNSIHAQLDLVADHLGTISDNSYNAATPVGAPDRRIDTRDRRVPRDRCALPRTDRYSTVTSRTMYGLSSQAYEVEPGSDSVGRQLDAYGPKPVLFSNEMACWELLATIRGTRSLSGTNTDTELIVARNNDTDDLVVAFRGTDGFFDILNDLDARRSSWRLPDGRTVNNAVHAGFANALDAARSQLISVLRREHRSGTPDSRVFFTGHSLGGALATLGSLDMYDTLIQLGYTEREIVTYTYGAPRSLSRTMVGHHRAFLPNSYAVANPTDPVPHLPSGGSDPYAHLSQMVLLNADLGDRQLRLEAGDGRSYARCTILNTSVTDHVRGAYALRMSFSDFLGAPTVRLVSYDDPIPFAIDNLRMVWDGDIEGPCDQVGMWNRTTAPTGLSDAIRDRWAVLDTNDQHSTTVNVGDANWVGYVGMFGQIISLRGY